MNLTATLIGQTVTFIVFVWVCMKFIWPPLRTAMQERQTAIAEGLAAAEAADRKLAEAATGAEAELAQAKQEAAALIEQARKRASQMVEQAKDDALVEAGRVRETAQAELGQEVNRAKESLRSQVATLAIVGAERILESSIDADKHRDMLDRLAAEL